MVPEEDHEVADDDAGAVGCVPGDPEADVFAVDLQVVLADEVEGENVDDTSLEEPIKNIFEKNFDWIARVLDA